MCRDQVLRSLWSYIEETDDGLSDDLLLSEHQFEEVAIARWAITELLGLIIDHPFESPDDIVYEFALKMMYYRETSEGSDSVERIFSIAAETALECLDSIVHES